MSVMTGRTAIGRALACAVLASFLLSFAPPSGNAAADQAMGCMEHHPLPSGSTVSSHTSACDSGPMDWCSMMPGCAALPLALAGSIALLPASPPPAPAEPLSPPPLHGRLALGPPTPPPNR